MLYNIDEIYDRRRPKETTLFWFNRSILKSNKDSTEDLFNSKCLCTVPRINSKVQSISLVLNYRGSFHFSYSLLGTCLARENTLVFYTDLLRPCIHTYINFSFFLKVFRECNRCIRVYKN